MTMNKKRLTLTILLMLMAAPLAMLTYADDTDPEDPEVETEKVIDPLVLGKLKGWCGELGEYFGGFDPELLPPAIRNQLTHAKEVYDEGLLVEEDNPDEAGQHYWNAMVHFRNALRKMQKEGIVGDEFSIPDKRNEEVPPAPDEIPPEEIEGTKLQLMNQFENNFRERIGNLKQLIDESEDLSPEDIEKLQSMVQRHEEKLERMRLKLSEGDVEGAIIEAEEGNEDFDETLEGLDDKEAGKMLKELNKMEAKILKMQHSMQFRRNRGDEIDPEEEDLLNQANGKLKNAKDNFKKGNKKGAQDDLDGAGDDLKGNKGKGKGQDKDKDKDKEKDK